MMTKVMVLLFLVAIVSACAPANFTAKSSPGNAVFSPGGCVSNCGGGGGGGNPPGGGGGLYCGQVWPGPYSIIRCDLTRHVWVTNCPVAPTDPCMSTGIYYNNQLTSLGQACTPAEYAPGYVLKPGEPPPTIMLGSCWQKM